MKQFLICAAFSTVVLTAHADTLKLQVNGMVCAFCAQGIEKRLSKLPDTGPLYIDLAKKVVAVEAKPGRTIDAARVRAEITDAGYDVVQTDQVPQSVAAIRAEMKAARK